MAFNIHDFAFEQHTQGGPEVLFQASDIDEAGATKYYGLMTYDGHWLILEVTSTTIRYAEGKTKATYLVAWAGRAGLSYGYYCDLTGV